MPQGAECLIGTGETARFAGVAQGQAARAEVKRNVTPGAPARRSLRLHARLAAQAASPSGNDHASIVVES
jgi:hypothetical protein